MILNCCDVETTGLTPEDAIVELGICPVEFVDGSVQIGNPASKIVNPHRQISVEALACHHIQDEEAATGLEFVEALDWALGGADVIVAHHAKYEQQYIKTEQPWICTYKIALHLAPQAPSHSLQVLRYWLRLAVDPVLAMPPHRAAPDAYCCAHLLARMLAKISIEEMIDISSRPALLPKLRFGKHGELPLAQVPKDYLRWILSQDFDEDVKYTANHYLRL